MNERIEQLAEQAGMRHPVMGERCYTDFNHKKFAELIVHQILDITDSHTEVFQTDRDKALIEHIKQSVKQHFGVEE